MLSEDDGMSWPHRLLLDERMPVSYPDAVQGDDGIIRAVYDFDRYGEKEICMAKFTEDDVISGRLLSKKSKLKMLVNRAG
jgi:hypothetical protein